VAEQMQEVRAVQNAEVLRAAGAAVAAQLDDQIATINQALAPLASGTLAAAVLEVHRQRWALSPAVTEALRTSSTPAVARTLRALAAARAAADGPDVDQEALVEDD
jgi:hypothetical protein